MLKSRHLYKDDRGKGTVYDKKKGKKIGRITTLNSSTFLTNIFARLRIFLFVNSSTMCFDQYFAVLTSLIVNVKTCFVYS